MAADQYSVWNTDNNGNYMNNAIGVVSGASATLKSFESTFQQDLNGDGATGATTAAPLMANQDATNAGFDFDFAAFLQTDSQARMEATWGALNQESPIEHLNDALSGTHRSIIDSAGIGDAISNDPHAVSAILFDPMGHFIIH